MVICKNCGQLYKKSIKTKVYAKKRKLNVLGFVGLKRTQVKWILKRNENVKISQRRR